MAMKEKSILYFSISPVQGFIARARRTRDFWAGSFLLSYLAGQAMAVVLENGGSLIIPAVAKRKDAINDPLLEAVVRIRGKQAIDPADENLRIATLPNRFRAEIPPDFAPNRCKEAVKEAWSKLCQAVWERYVQPVTALGQNTEEIWRRQVDHFWEIVWVRGETTFPLERRKNWRSHIPPVEYGDKCSLFEDLQELSGYVRAKSKAEREKQDRFWAALRKQIGRHELDENERLSAVALVKRLFPLVAPEVLWEVPVRYPSTPYLAAVTWLQKVAASPEKAQAAQEYATDCARYLPGSARREDPDLFPALKEICAARMSLREFLSLDGKCFIKDAMLNPRVWQEQTDAQRNRDAFNTAEEHKKTAKRLVEKLSQLGEPVSPFYAMLVMDGDLLGRLLQKCPESVSEALGRFSQQVPSIIQEHNGITVYAGGDDVLALLPLEGSISAAAALRKAYVECFDDTNEILAQAGEDKLRATISGAVVYAHYTTMFTEVYAEAQRLLSQVAKNETGRDSLALTVWKRAGQVLTWSAPWEVVLEEKPNIYSFFVDRFRKDMQPSKKDTMPSEATGIGAREFTTSFLYNIQSRLGDIQLDAGSGLRTEEEKDAFFVDLITAEYLKCRERERSVGRKEARQLVEKLLPLCQRWWRDESGITQRAADCLSLDGIFLLKFLLQKGVE